MSSSVLIKLETPFNPYAPKVNDIWTLSKNLSVYVYPEDIDAFADAMDNTNAQRIDDDSDETTWEVTGSLSDLRTQLAEFYRKGDSSEDYSQLLPEIPDGWEKSTAEITILW